MTDDQELIVSQRQEYDDKKELLDSDENFKRKRKRNYKCKRLSEEPKH